MANDTSSKASGDVYDFIFWIRIFINQKSQFTDVPTIQRYTVLVSVGLIIGCLLLKTLLRRPYVLVVINPILLVVGFSIGKIIKLDDVYHEFDQPASGANLFVVNILLALHVIQMTQSLDLQKFWREFWIITLMSVINMTAQMTLLLALVYALMNRSKDWNLFTSLFFTAIICPNDNYFMRSAISATQGDTKKAVHLLQGETVLTTGISMFLIHSLRYLNKKIELTGELIASSIFYGLIGLFIGFLVIWLAKLPLKYACQSYKEFFLLSFGLPIFVYLVSIKAYTAAIPSVIVTGAVLTGYKIRLTSEVDSFHTVMWDILNFVVTLFVQVMAGILLALVEHDCNLFDFGYIIALYCLVIFVRTISCIAMSRFLLGPQITWKHVKLFIWANAKGTINITVSAWCLSTGYYYSNQIFIYVVCMSCLCTFFNAVLVRSYMSLEGLFHFRRPKLVNMNMAVAQINQCREQALIALKSDRVMSNANWYVVERMSRLDHPYRKFLKNMAALDILDTKQEMRTLECNVCGTEIPAPLSKKEFDEIILEAKHRVLKAQMVSFFKQYESGVLSLGAVTTLGGLVDAATIKDDPVLLTADLKIHREGSPCLRSLHRFLVNLRNITSFNYTRTSDNYVRSVCYTIVTSTRFQMTTAALSLFDSLIIILLIATYFDWSHSSLNKTFAWYAQLSDIIFWIIFMIEFFLCIIGLGPNQFFSYTINKIEFGSNVFIRTVEVWMYIDASISDPKSANVLEFHDGVLFYLKIFLLLRCVRIYSFAAAFLPKLISATEIQLEEDLLKSYDIGKAYLVALERISKYLGRIIGSELVMNDLKKIIEEERQKISKELGFIQKDNPIIAITVKTRHAIRQVVNTMNDCIVDMKDEGILDWNETKSMMNSLEDIKKNLKALERVRPSPPEYILRKISWLEGEETSTAILLENAQLCNYGYNDVIINYGDDPVGLYIVVSGMVRSSFKPMVSTLQLTSKFGVLPNYDFFSNLKLNETQEEYVVAGNVIGEIGVVTGRRYDMVVTCETAVQMYFVPWDVIRAITQDSDRSEEIRKKIWKTIGIRIGSILLQYKAQFQSWEREKLLLYLQRGVVLDLNGIVTIVFRHDLVDDVILIEGVVMEPLTGDIISAPCLLPATALRVLLPEHRWWDFQTVYRTQIMVVPNASVTEEDLFGPYGLFSENQADEKAMESALAPPPADEYMKEPSMAKIPSGRAGPGEGKFKRKVGFQWHEPVHVSDETSDQVSSGDKKTD